MKVYIVSRVEDNANELFLPLDTEMRTRQICDKLCKMNWQRYDVSTVPCQKRGIYAIGGKVGSKPIKYLYMGRSKNIKKRLQQHKSGNQAIDKRVAWKFKHNKESDLRIKHVHEARHKSKEAEYLDCLAKKIGYYPTLNKRRGDGPSGGKARPSKSEKAEYFLVSLIRKVLYG